MPIFSIFAAPFLSGHPYLDPGSGSLLLQLLLAAGLGGAFLVKMFWRKIISIFKKTDPNEAAETNEVTGENEE